MSIASIAMKKFHKYNFFQSHFQSVRSYRHAKNSTGANSRCTVCVMLLLLWKLFFLIICHMEVLCRRSLTQTVHLSFSIEIKRSKNSCHP